MCIDLCITFWVLFLKALPSKGFSGFCDSAIVTKSGVFLCLLVSQYVVVSIFAVRLLFLEQSVYYFRHERLSLFSDPSAWAAC